MSQQCYSRHQLLDFALGRLQDPAAKSIEMHIDACATCEETVAILDDATDSLLRHLRDGLKSTEAESPVSPEYQRALGELQEVDVVAHQSISSPTHVDESNPVILRDYELLEPLGFGGMGAVYRAKHLRLQKLVALKLLPARRMQDELSVSRFQREMRAIGQLDHPSVVRATDAGEEDGHHFLVMELVEGADLGRLVRQTGRLSVAEACELVRLAAVGMQHAHERGIVHRDLKPSNLMLAASGQLKILDLGLALLSSTNEGTVDELTTVGQLMGTLDYMAPEQFGDCHAVDHRVDVYSLGATLYKLLTGRAPYSGDQYQTPLQKLKGLATAEPANICAHLPEIPAELATTIHHALARSPAERIASAKDFGEALQPFAQRADLEMLYKDRSPRLTSMAATPPTIPPKPTDSIEHDSANDALSSRRDSGGRALQVAAGLLGCVLLGLTIFLQTNKGTLTIESPRDDLSLQIVKAGKPYKTLTVKKGKQSWALGLGDYEVQLGEDADSLTVENGKFTLRRGDEQLATIEAGNATATSMPATNAPSIGVLPSDGAKPTSREPLYANRSFSDWKLDFLTERSPNRRGQAVQAMLALADGQKQREAFDTIFDNSSEKDRSSAFLDETSGESNSVDNLLIAFLDDRPEQKTYALRRLFDTTSKYDALNVIRGSGFPTDQTSRNDIEYMIATSLESSSQQVCLRAAACGLHHANWLPDVGGKLRSALDKQENPRTKARLLFLLSHVEDLTTDDIGFLSELLLREASTPADRAVALAELIWLGPKASTATDSLIELLADRHSKKMESNFRFSELVDKSAGGFHLIYDTQHPKHVRETSLLGKNNWGRMNGNQHDAVVIALSCIGPRAKAAVPVLWKRLVRLRDELHLTWIAKRPRSSSSRRNFDYVVESLTKIELSRFPNRDAVLEELLGEKRVPVDLQAKPDDLAQEVYDEISLRLKAATADISVEGDDNRDWQNLVRTRLPGLHPAIRGVLNIVESNNRIQVILSYHSPAVRVRAGDKLVPTSSNGVALESSWYSNYSELSQLIVDVGDLRPIVTGEVWQNKLVLGAMSINYTTHDVVENSELTTIVANPETGVFQLVNDAKTWVFTWGHALGAEPAGETPVKLKLNALQEKLSELYRLKLESRNLYEFDLSTLSE